MSETFNLINVTRHKKYIVARVSIDSDFSLRFSIALKEEEWVFLSNSTENVSISSRYVQLKSNFNDDDMFIKFRDCRSIGVDPIVYFRDTPDFDNLARLVLEELESLEKKSIG